MILSISKLCINKLAFGGGLLIVQAGVRLVRGVVKDVQPDKIILTDGSEVPYGLLVWSTGVGASPFIKSLNIPKSPGGRYSPVQTKKYSL
jgi:NADH dehydrogenase FAD-containing subunit